MKKVIGYAMASTPFVGLFIFAALDQGLKVAFEIFGVIAIILCWAGVAAYLITSKNKEG